MDSFKTVYRILNFLKESEKYDEFDDECFNAEYFGLTDRQFSSTLERMIDDGHVKGLSIKRGADGYVVISLMSPSITTAGLEYLSENSFMRKAAKAAKGIVEIIT